MDPQRYSSGDDALRNSGFVIFFRHLCLLMFLFVITLFAIYSDVSSEYALHVLTSDEIIKSWKMPSLSNILWNTSNQMGFIWNIINFSSCEIPIWKQIKDLCNNFKTTIQLDWWPESFSEDIKLNWIYSNSYISYIIFLFDAGLVLYLFNK